MIMDLAEGKFRMEGSKGSVLVMNISGVILGMILGFFLLSVRLIFSPILFIVLVVVLISYMSWDYFNWRRNGVRALELDDNGIDLYKGEEKKLTRIEAKDITGMNISNKLGRRVVTIFTGGSAVKPLPGITFFTGPRIRVPEDAFDPKEFGVFIEKIRKFGSLSQQG